MVRPGGTTPARSLDASSPEKETDGQTALQCRAVFSNMPGDSSLAACQAIH